MPRGHYHSSVVPLFFLVYFKEGARETSIRKQEPISKATMETNFEGGEGRGSEMGDVGLLAALLIEFKCWT